MTDESRIVGTLLLPVSLYCTREVLGAEFPVQIAGRSGTVAVPGLPADIGPELGFVQLERPRNFDDRVPGRLGSGGERVHQWGRPQQWPTLNSLVKAIAIWFPLSAPESDAITAHAISEELRAGIPEWTESLMTGLEVLTRQTLDRASIAQIAAHETDLFLVARAAPLKPLSASVITIPVIIPNSDTAATLDQWQLAIRCASEDRHPRLEHVILRDARHALRRREFRRTVIDAGTALELALTSRLSAHLVAALGSHAAETILARSQGLGSRIGLAGSVGLPLGSHDLRRELVKPRNEATHRGASPPHSTALQALQAAMDAVTVLVPDPFDALTSGGHG